jgi:hypothetical protein
MKILSNRRRFTYEVRFYGTLSTPATGPDYRGEQAIAGIAGTLIPKARNHPAPPSLLGRNSCQLALKVGQDAGRSGWVCSLDGKTLSQASPRALIVADRQPAQLKGGQTARKGALNSPYGEQKLLI